jgi:hypothetical protein
VVVNVLLSRFAEWLERRIGSRVRSRVAGSGAEPPAGAPQNDGLIGSSGRQLR